MSHPEIKCWKGLLRKLKFRTDRNGSPSRRFILIGIRTLSPVSGVRGGPADAQDTDRKVSGRASLRSREIAEAIASMLSRSAHVTIRCLVILPQNQDLYRGRRTRIGTQSILRLCAAKLSIMLSLVSDRDRKSTGGIQCRHHAK